MILNTLNEMEFYQSYTFRMQEVDFKKLLLTRSETLDMDSLWNLEDDAMIDALRKEKEHTATQKQKSIDQFIDHIESHHLWLSKDQMIQHIKQMSPDTDLYHIPISVDLLENILIRINDKYELFESSDHFIIEKSKTFMLFEEKIRYQISVSYTKELLFGVIWRGEELPVAEDLNQVNEELLAHFNLSVDALYDHMLKLSEGLSIPTTKLESFIIQFLEPQIKTTQTLKIKEKSKRRILYHFSEYLKPLKEKRMREELLAKTIRDFKNLFPLARSLKRKILFHVGPTNSGKTYAALQKLKAADTGYYLAPLRLLALEGYENLKNEGIPISLITGEEEIIDEESTHISSTIEMLNNSIDVDVCVIDDQ